MPKSPDLPPAGLGARRWPQPPRPTGQTTDRPPASCTDVNNLAEDQSADDGDAQRTAQLRSGPDAQRQRNGTEQRRERRHHDRTEAQQAGFIDRVDRRLAFLALRFQREVDHHDGVLLHDTDQQDDADQGHHAQIQVEQHEREDRAHAGRRQRRQNRDGVDVALIQHAQHDVHGDDGGQNQPAFIGQRGLEGARRSLERQLNAGRQVDIGRRLLDGLHRLAQRSAVAQVERDGHGGKLALVVDGQRAGRCLEVRDGAERHLLRCGAENAAGRGHGRRLAPSVGVAGLCVPPAGT